MLLHWRTWDTLDLVINSYDSDLVMLYNCFDPYISNKSRQVDCGQRCYSRVASVEGRRRRHHG